MSRCTIQKLWCAIEVIYMTFSSCLFGKVQGSITIHLAAWARAKPMSDAITGSIESSSPHTTTICSWGNVIRMNRYLFTETVIRMSEYSDICWILYSAVLHRLKMNIEIARFNSVLAGRVLETCHQLLNFKRWLFNVIPYLLKSSLPSGDLIQSDFVRTALILIVIGWIGRHRICPSISATQEV